MGREGLEGEGYDGEVDCCPACWPGTSIDTWTLA